MNPQQIHLLDPRRLLVGNNPTWFLLEIAGRAVVTYVILWAAMRIMGKRVAGQMSAMELTIIVTLGAAIGVPLQAPERGLIGAVVILAVAIVYQRGLSYWAFKSRRAELTLQGDVATVVADGCLELNELRRAVLSRERLFSALRQQGLVHLGQVKRAYLEADGHFSIYQDPDPPPGLCLFPAADTEWFEQRQGVADQHACRSCGNVVHHAGGQPAACGRCGAGFWSPAVRSAAPADLLPPPSEDERNKPPAAGSDDPG